MEPSLCPVPRVKGPNRRLALTHDIEIGDCRATATIGFDEANWPREVFLVGGKAGSDIAKILDDAAVVISIALQHGISAAALAKSVGRQPPLPLLPSDLDKPDDDRDRPAATVLGVVLDLVSNLEPSLEPTGTDRATAA